MKTLARAILAVFALTSPAFIGACATGGGTVSTEKPGNFVLLASTIGPIDAGIVGALEDGFEKETGIRVRHVGAGTGAALDIARQGSVDLVLVHAKALEEKFVAEGFGTGRIPLMFNDFVIVGPSADPAGIRGMKTAAEALRAIGEKQALFVTRGDQSGTHVAEMGLWEKAGVKPAGAWYEKFEKGSTGNVPTLKYADEKGAYTVMDRATLITVRSQVKCDVLVENDEAMLNHISLIPVNPAKLPRVNYAAAIKFAGWMTDAGKGQLVIRDFGKEKYGAPLFFPESEEWRKAQGR
jgi:tungstate transport system substrate-binding protein